jgi:hypothetical protein
MTEGSTTSFDNKADDTGIDIGRPVQWLIDPEDRSIILGITYEFGISGVRKTVWYTASKRRPKHFQAVTEVITE